MPVSFHSHLKYMGHLYSNIYDFELYAFVKSDSLTKYMFWRRIATDSLIINPLEVGDFDSIESLTFYRLVILIPYSH